MKKSSEKKFKKRLYERFTSRYNALLARLYPQYKTTALLPYEMLGAYSWLDAIDNKIPLILNYSQLARQSFVLDVINPNLPVRRLFHWSNLQLTCKKRSYLYKPGVTKSVTVDVVRKLRAILERVKGEEVDPSEKFVTERVNAEKLHSLLCKSLNIPHKGLGRALIRAEMNRLEWRYYRGAYGSPARYERIVRNRADTK